MLACLFCLRIKTEKGGKEGKLTREMKEREELVLVGLARFHGSDGGGGRSLSFL